MSDGSACKLWNIAKELEHRMCSSNNEAQVNDEYQAEYRCLLRELGAQFAIGDSPWEQVVHSMSVIDHEMNGNGGVNWEESAYTEFLDALRKRFTPDQLAKIRWSLDEILACGRWTRFSHVVEGLRSRGNHSEVPLRP